MGIGVLFVLLIHEFVEGSFSVWWGDGTVERRDARSGWEDGKMDEWKVVKQISTTLWGVLCLCFRRKTEKVWIWTVSFGNKSWVQAERGL